MSYNMRDLEELIGSPEHLENIGFKVVSLLLNIMNEFDLEGDEIIEVQFDEIEVNGGDLADAVVAVVSQELREMFASLSEEEEEEDGV